MPRSPLTRGCADKAVAISRRGGERGGAQHRSASGHTGRLRAGERLQCAVLGRFGFSAPFCASARARPCSLLQQPHLVQGLHCWGQRVDGGERRCLCGARLSPRPHGASSTRGAQPRPQHHRDWGCRAQARGAAGVQPLLAAPSGATVLCPPPGGGCAGAATAAWSRGWPGARRGPRAVGAPRSGWAVMIEVIVRDAGGRIHELIPANEGHVQRGRARGTSPRHSSPTPGDTCVPSRPPQPDPPSAAEGLRCARGVRGTVVRGPGVRCPPGESHQSR